MSTKAEKAYLNRLVEMGCIVCKNLGYGASPAHVHHIRTGIGMGQRASNYDTIPLCPTHHQHGGIGVAIHAGQKTWEALYGTELELLKQTKEELKNDYCN